MPTLANTPEGNRATLFFEPPQSLKPEMDMNSKIFLCRDATDNPAFVSKKTISQLILNPTAVGSEFSTLKMRDMALRDDLRPAHLPNVADLYPFPELAVIILKSLLNTQHAIPYCMQHLIDPEPVLDLTLPVYKLGFDTLYLCMATYSDAIQVVEVPEYPSVLILTIFAALESSLRAPYHTVAFDPVSCPPWVPYLTNVSIHTRMLTWNVRGFTRESFIANFNVVYRYFKPSLIVLLETRHFLENVNEVINRLPRNFNVITCPTCSLSGGYVVIWKEEVIKIVQNPTFQGGEVINVLFQGVKQKSKLAKVSKSKPKFICCGRF
ncbi:uncharacterized protein LOC110709287 [Chenopodium quinoa]|uniref:uncharacterized protein LOC110709287 n=1 Tax=Chenopodium quinoa TaxID=63459 RepID=UPI000B77BA2B|nr:uncharacterized protein LOC110709287 [Chenopodium quinoa]